MYHTYFYPNQGTRQGLYIYCFCGWDIYASDKHPAWRHLPQQYPIKSLLLTRTTPRLLLLKITVYCSPHGPLATSLSPSFPPKPNASIQEKVVSIVTHSTLSSKHFSPNAAQTQWHWYRIWRPGPSSQLEATLKGHLSFSALSTSAEACNDLAPQPNSSLWPLLLQFLPSHMPWTQPVTEDGNMTGIF